MLNFALIDHEVLLVELQKEIGWQAKLADVNWLQALSSQLAKQDLAHDGEKTRQRVHQIAFLNAAYLYPLVFVGIARFRRTVLPMLSCNPPAPGAKPVAVFSPAPDFVAAVSIAVGVAASWSSTPQLLDSALGVMPPILPPFVVFALPPSVAPSCIDFGVVAPG